MSRTRPLSAKHIETIADDELPIQLTNDALGCPHCRVELTNRKSRVFVESVTIGMFDSMACEFCGFFLLTEKGFDESAKVITLLGLDRLEQDIISPHYKELDQAQNVDSVSTTELEHAWQRLTSVNPNHIIHKQIVDKTGGDEWDAINPGELSIITNPPLSTMNKPFNS